MDRLNELEEAKLEADILLTRLDKAISSLKTASSWGIFDIFGGGSFSSFVKRENYRALIET